MLYLYFISEMGTVIYLDTDAALIGGTGIRDVYQYATQCCGLRPALVVPTERCGMVNAGTLFLPPMKWFLDPRHSDEVLPNLIQEMQLHLSRDMPVAQHLLFFRQWVGKVLESTALFPLGDRLSRLLEELGPDNTARAAAILAEQLSYEQYFAGSPLQGRR